MAIIKCKMCGGDIELTSDKTFGTCEFCGSTMTLPKIDDDQRAVAFNRGNHFRRIGEFDKALAVYERIVREDDTDAEAHWCCALCRFGIEYVEDPATYEYLPTCHRASFDSFLEDVDYLAAVEYSEGITKRQYQKDAAKIAEVQRGILATSQNTEPYDVFICYKESDASGERTRDSLMAQDIYYQLTEQGRKVFFARITLEDVAGTQYEPYIFAALNSAKVMIVVGTKAEYLNAVWVKNEWSRFLAMMKKDRHKLLLPCYRDMDPYDMPEALAVLQSYDMGKIGFIQDLIRGIKKITQTETPTATVVKETIIAGGNANTAPLLKRAFMFLEDGDWDAANEYCEKVLDMDPECPEAYIGKLMAELHVCKKESLKDCAQPFDSMNNYQKAMRFASGELRATLMGYIDHIYERNENARRDGIYTRAKAMMSAANSENAYKEAAQLFESNGEYQDSGELAKTCRDEAETARKNAILAAGKAKMTGDVISNYQTAINILEPVSGWKDADEQIVACRRKIEEIAWKEEAERLAKARKAEIARREAERIAKRNEKITIIAMLSICVITAVIAVFYTIIIPNIKYNEAIALMDAEKYSEAILAFEALGGRKDSVNKIEECNNAILDKKYNEAVALMDAGRYTEAISAFPAEYKDSVKKISECKIAILDGKYNDAIALMDAGEYTKAISVFEALDGYKDSTNKIAECNTAILDGKYNDAIALMDAEKYSEAISAFAELDSYKDAKAQIKAAWDEIAVRDTISTGYYHTVGLKADGTVVAVGYKRDGRCDVAGWKNIVAISAGFEHTVGLKANGTVLAVGVNDDGKCDVTEWKNIVAISAGSEHTVGLKADGTVVAVGTNEFGQCNVTGWKNIVAISAADNHTVGLKADGTVVAVGQNAYGQCNVTGWKNIVAISADGVHTVGLKADGTVVAVGPNKEGQCDVTGWKNIVAISTSHNHTVGLKADGTVVAIGSESDGKCDVTGWKNIKLPKAVE